MNHILKVINVKIVHDHWLFYKEQHYVVEMMSENMFMWGIDFVN